MRFLQESLGFYRVYVTIAKHTHLIGARIQEITQGLGEILNFIPCDGARDVIAWWEIFLTVTGIDETSSFRVTHE
jgi:hypothetical protein